MTPRPVSSDEIRGIGARAWLSHLVRGAGYAGFVVIGVLGVFFVASGEIDRPVAGWFFVLLGMLGIVGLVGVGQQAWFVRNRPGVALGAAPSGRPATVVLRSAFTTGMSIAVSGALAVFFAAATGALLVAGSGWLALTGLMTAILVWPLVPAARGQVRAGGLYLTTEGIEHRRDAVLWSLPWSAVTGAVPGEPVALVLDGRPGVETTSTTRWVWNREPRAPSGVVGVDCRTLGLDGVLVAAALNTALAHPERRADLGTGTSLSWEMFL